MAFEKLSCSEDSEVRFCLAELLTEIQVLSHAKVPHPTFCLPPSMHCDGCQMTGLVTDHLPATLLAAGREYLEAGTRLSAPCKGLRLILDVILFVLFDI